MSWQSQMEKARRRKPTEQTLQVCVDDDAAAAYYAAGATLTDVRRDAVGRVALAAAKGGGERLTTETAEPLVDADPEVVAATARRDEARAAMDAATVAFTFRSLPPDAFDALVAEHPPRDDNEQDAKSGVNVETFAPALVAACHVHYEDGVEQDGMTLDDARELFTAPGWSTADRDALFSTAWGVNTTSRMEYVSLGKG